MEDLGRGLSYKAVRSLGEGSHGVVLLVQHTRLDKPFVMKLIQQKFLANSDIVSRFIAEAQRGARLNHEAFAPIVDLGETQDGRTYFVMEYVEGSTLLDVLRTRGALPIDQAVVLGLQLLDGLAAAHDAHLIHRDIKPANLFITNRGRLKILDLGISKSILDSGTGPNTAHGVAIGTPRYMSPEQAKGLKVTFATDLYAVGLVLFEMLAGVPAFDARDTAEIIRQQVEDPAPTLAQRTGRTFPAALEALIARSLMKVDTQRFQTAREMQHALHGVLEALRSPEAFRTSSPDVAFAPPAAPPMDDATIRNSRQVTVIASQPPVDAMFAGVASTTPSARPPAGPLVDANAPTELLRTVTARPFTATGGATTRTHDDARPATAIASTSRSSRPILVVAALCGGLGVLVAGISAIVWIARGTTDDRASTASSASTSTAVDPTVSAPPSVVVLAPPSAQPSETSSAIPSATPSALPSATASASASTPPSAVPKKPAPTAKPPSHYQLAVEAMNGGDLDTADEEARLAVSQGGGISAQLLLAQILEKRGTKAAAREVYRQVLEKDPTMAAAVAGLKRCGG